MCNKDVISELKYVQKQFLCAVPIPKINWKNIFDVFNCELQENLVSRTVNLSLVLEYPIQISYQKSFLKHLINRLERKGLTPSDCLYDAFGRVVALGDAGPYFRHYFLENGKIISLKENSSFISEGTTGLCSWQASLALSEWCLGNEEFLKGQAVVELGSGVGLTGLTVALCQAKQVFLTDGHPSVLKVLEDNVRLNSGLIPTDTDVQVLSLPWENIDTNRNLPSVDILLAADVVYDSSVFPCLLNAILHFFKFGTKTLVIACTERNPTTLKQFLLLLESNHIIYEELKNYSQHNFLWSTESPIKIFLCSLSSMNGNRNLKKM
ncbi:protein-lysine N-methyltransferase EEF2KMT isoform X2 [Photinus pyralis]|uniref:protein-lysine N-methyltransferase EEF2KMT isoform X2 n=1 Tax=Photinus pyralis TaxID=7054 RepID=UPI00126710F0|nr:protein-lysine N-methyltransferase EEF2KMT isoform X2 [Photinus pyralis]